MRRVYESEPGRMETLDTAADELFLFSLEGESARTRRHQKIYAPRVCWRPERARPPSASATIHPSRRKGHCTLPFLTVSDGRRPLFWNPWSWLNKPAIRYKTANRNAAMAGNDRCNLDKQAYVVKLSQVCIFFIRVLTVGFDKYHEQFHDWGRINENTVHTSDSFCERVTQRLPSQESTFHTHTWIQL